MYPTWLGAGVARPLRGKMDAAPSVPGLYLDTSPPTKKAATAARFFAAIHRTADPEGMEREVMIQKQMNWRTHDVLIRANRRAVGP